MLMFRLLPVLLILSLSSAPYSASHLSSYNILKAPNFEASQRRRTSVENGKQYYYPASNPENNSHIGLTDSNVSHFISRNSPSNYQDLDHYLFSNAPQNFPEGRFNKVPHPQDGSPIHSINLEERRQPNQVIDWRPRGTREKLEDEIGGGLDNYFDESKVRDTGPYTFLSSAIEGNNPVNGQGAITHNSYIFNSRSKLQVDSGKSPIMSNQHHRLGPTCINIPRNLTLCQGIGYGKMRLPNLLDHDTLDEVIAQARSWVPLLSVGCHSDARIFLCSLYSPVCLDRPIYPCRSLCQAVRNGCEARMKLYGFPWPKILECQLFPPDNDLCIAPQSRTNTHSASTTHTHPRLPYNYNNINNINNNLRPAISNSINHRSNNYLPAIQGHNVHAKKSVIKNVAQIPICEICLLPWTYEKILDFYCKSDVVLKIKNNHKTFTLVNPRNYVTPQGNTKKRNAAPHYRTKSLKTREASGNGQKHKYHPFLVKNYQVKRIFKRGTFLDFEFTASEPKMVYMHMTDEAIGPAHNPSHQKQAHNTQHISRNIRNRYWTKKSPTTEATFMHRCNCPFQNNSATIAPTRNPTRFFLIMGQQYGNKIMLNLALPWNKKDPMFRKAIKKVKSLDCGQDFKRSIS